MDYTFPRRGEQFITRPEAGDGNSKARRAAQSTRDVVHSSSLPPMSGYDYKKILLPFLRARHASGYFEVDRAIGEAGQHFGKIIDRQRARDLCRDNRLTGARGRPKKNTPIIPPES